MSIASRHPVILVALPLAFAALCPLLGAWKKRLSLPWAMLGTAATAFLAWTLTGRMSAARPVTYNLGRWGPPWGIQLRVDTLALVAVCTISTVMLLFLLYTGRGGVGLSPESLPYYHALFLLALAGMLGFTMAGDLFNMFIFMEVFSLASYALVAVSRKAPALRAAFRFLLFGVASSAVFALALGLLYSVTGALDMRKASLRLATMDSRYVPVAVAALALFMVALAVKAALPLAHWWFPDAAAEALEPAGALVAGFALAMGALGMFRILNVVFSGGHVTPAGGWSPAAQLMAWSGALAIIAFSARALVQSNIKRVAACCALAQIGYVVMGVSMASPRGAAAGLWGFLAGASGGACLFLVAGIFIHVRGTGFTDGLRGVGRSMPVSAGAFALASLSVAGVPLTAGFASRALLFRACLERHQYFLATILPLGSLMVAVCLARVLYTLFSPDPAGNTGLDEAHPTMYLPAALLSLGALMAGILGSPVTRALQDAARMIFNR